MFSQRTVGKSEQLGYMKIYLLQNHKGGLVDLDGGGGGGGLRGAMGSGNAWAFEYNSSSDEELEEISESKGFVDVGIPLSSGENTPLGSPVVMVYR